MTEIRNKSLLPLPLVRPIPQLELLPDELQQLIYRFVYPTTDMTLIPDIHPSFTRRSLTYNHNIHGNHDLSLLLACSKIYAVAKPIRDSSFSGILNVYRRKDLIECGDYLHRTLHTIRYIPYEKYPNNDAIDDFETIIHHELFTNLHRIELFDTRTRSQRDPSTSNVPTAAAQDQQQSLQTQNSQTSRSANLNLANITDAMELKYMHDAERLALNYYFPPSLLDTYNDPSHLMASVPKIEFVVKLEYIVTELWGNRHRCLVGIKAQITATESKVLEWALIRDGQLKYWDEKNNTVVRTSVEQAPSKFKLGAFCTPQDFDEDLDWLSDYQQQSWGI